MTISKKDYENDLLHAFQQGMVVGYGIDHTHLSVEEREASINYIQDKGFKYSYEELMGINKEIKEK